MSVLPVKTNTYPEGGHSCPPFSGFFNSLIRVLKYERLRNMVVLVTAAMFFASVVIGTKMKLKVLASHVLNAAKGIFGIPDFRYYAISDGIREVLTRFPHRLSGKNKDDPPLWNFPLFDP